MAELSSRFLKSSTSPWAGVMGQHIVLQQSLEKCFCFLSIPTSAWKTFIECCYGFELFQKSFETFQRHLPPMNHMAVSQLGVTYKNIICYCVQMDIVQCTRYTIMKTTTVMILTNTGCPRKKCVLEPNLTGCSGNHFPEAAGQFHVFFSLDRLILTARNTHKIFKTHLFLWHPVESASMTEYSCYQLWLLVMWHRLGDCCSAAVTTFPSKGWVKTHFTSINLFTWSVSLTLTYR